MEKQLRLYRSQQNTIKSAFLKKNIWEVDLNFPDANSNPGVYNLKNRGCSFSFREGNFKIGEPSFNFHSANYNFGEANCNAGEANCIFREVNLEFREANCIFTVTIWLKGEGNLLIGDANSGVQAVVLGV